MAAALPMSAPSGPAMPAMSNQCLPSATREHAAPPGLRRISSDGTPPRQNFLRPVGYLDRARLVGATLAAGEGAAKSGAIRYQLKPDQFSDCPLVRSKGNFLREYG